LQYTKSPEKGDPNKWELLFLFCLGV
jgi:hypothetical protein